MANDKELVAKYAGLLAAVRIIASMHVSDVDATKAQDTARAMKRIATEAAEHGA